MNDHIQKMHEAKRKARNEEIWTAVERAIAREGCKCNLRKGMTRDELPHGAGCKSPNYVCPALDTFRRLLPPAPIPEEQLALEAGVSL